MLYVIQGIPEVQYSGLLLATGTAKCINSLGTFGFNIRCMVNDYHSENVNSFKCSHKDF